MIILYYVYALFYAFYSIAFKMLHYIPSNVIVYIPTPQYTTMTQFIRHHVYVTCCIIKQVVFLER